MSEIASAFVSLMPSAKGFGSATQRQIAPGLNSAAKTSGSRFGKVFAYSSMSPLKAIGAAAFGLFAIKKVKDFFGSAISEARESQKVSAITAQVIKSTGGAAQISAKQVGQLSTAISLKTGIDDEQIQSSANMLLTFKNLQNVVGKGNDIFNRATGIVTDMSVALGTGAKSAAIQVGKALNDPIKGITALTRVGVTFTQKTKDQITTLVAHGKTLLAQKIILRELGSEFGGTAAAAATAGDKFKVAFANFQESVGTALLPQLDRLLVLGTEVISVLMTKVPPAFAAVKAAVMPVAQAIGNFVSAHLQPFLAILSGLGGAAIAAFAALLGGTLLSAIGLLAAALASPVALIGALVGASIYAYTHFTGFRTAVDSLVAALRANFLPVLQQAATTFTTVILPAITALVTYLATKLGPVFTQIAAIVTGTVLPILASLAAFVYGQLYPALIQIVAAVATRLKPVFDQLVATFQAKVLPTIQQLLVKFREYQPQIQAVILVVVKIIGKFAEFSATIIGKVLPIVIRLGGVFFATMVPAVIAVIGVVVKIIAKMIEFGKAVVDRIQDVIAFVKAVKDKIGDAIGFIQDIPGKAKDALGDLGALLYNAGRNLISGLIDGIKSKIGDVTSAVSGVADHIKGFFGGSPVEHGPLLPWNTGTPGKVLMGMLAKGITDGTPEVAGAVDGVATKIREGLERTRDALKSTLDGLKSDFASLRDSIASSFTGNMFEGATGADFFTQNVATMTNLEALRKAFQKLRKWGIDPKFLSALFSSGNAPLILDLASGPKFQAVNDAQLFHTNNQLANQLGGQVARADVGPKIDETNRRLERIEKAISRQGREFGRELNNAVSHGHRQRVA